jgi:23S rRNA (pseudouridine1915-N3)-methyltransferase
VKIRLVTFGKTASWLSEAADRYLVRVKRHCDFEHIVLKESSARKNEDRLKEEAQTFDKKIGLNSPYCLLTEEGRLFDTVKLAAWMENISGGGSGSITFVIGSAYGFHEDMKRNADWKLSLSPLTFPHDLAHVLMLEQIYRCLMVLQNHPYHHV